MFNFLPLGYYAWSGFFISVATTAISIFVLSKDPKSPIHRSLCFFALSTAGWSFFYFLALTTSRANWADFYLRTLMIPVSFISSTFTHFVLTLVRSEKTRQINRINYLISLFFASLVYTDLFARPGGPFLVFPYWAKTGSLYHLHLTHFLFNILYSHFLMIRAIRRNTGVSRNQILYVFIGTTIGFSSGTLNYFPWYRVPFPPIFNALVPLYVGFISYSIIRYRLMDITTVIHKTILWLVMSCGVTLPVVGLFYLARPWLMNLSGLPFALVAGALALFLIPYVRFIQPCIDHLFQRRKYDLQKVLQDFIHEVEVLKSLDELVNKLLTTISSVLYPESISVALLDVKSGRLLRSVGLPVSFTLEEHKSFLKQMEKENKICDDSSMVEEEAKRYFNALQARVIVPLSHDGKLLGVVNLGIKRNLKAYSASELAFLSSLETEASIALSNSLLYDEVQNMSQELRAWALELEDKVKDRTRELAKSKEEIEAAYSKLQELDRLKTQFFGNISHELRTPLTLILAPVEMMIKEGHLEPHQTKNLNVVRNNALRLLKLMNQLLDLIKIDAGKMELRLSQVNVRDFLREIEDSMSALAEQKNLKLSFNCEESLLGEFDRDQIEKVVMNLIYNAVKFTPEGGSIEVRARKVEGEEEPCAEKRQQSNI